MGNTSWQFNGVIDVLDSGSTPSPCLFSSTLISNHNLNGVNYPNNNTSYSKTDTEINIDLTALSIRVYYINTSLSGSTNNFVRKFVVDVRKAL